jgi:hypothetical protein
MTGKVVWDLIAGLIIDGHTAADAGIDRIYAVYGDQGQVLQTLLLD